MRYAAEAWRRNKAGEIDDEEMYCSDATWSGIHPLGQATDSLRVRICNGKLATVADRYYSSGPFCSGDS
jgi:hypothetical protein